jgi:hypothetical protein
VPTTISDQNAFNRRDPIAVPDDPCRNLTAPVGLPQWMPDFRD